MQIDLFGPVPVAPKTKPTKEASEAGRALRNARKAGTQAAEACAKKARKVDPRFVEKACAHILKRLEGGARTGEELVDSCLDAGIKPHDARAFGVVFARLARTRQAQSRISLQPRRKGHCTSGLREWELVRS